MSYPRWFPYPGSWLRAVVLLLSLIPLIAVRIHYSLDIYALDRESQILLSIKLVVLPMIIFTFINHWLWGKPKPSLSWKPSSKSLFEACWSWFFCVVALMLCTGVEYIRYDGYLDLATVLDPDCDNYLKIIFLVVTAYLYQARAVFFPKIRV